MNDKKTLTALNLFDQALEIDKDNSLALFGKGKIFVKETLTLNIGREMLFKSIPGLKDKPLRKEAYLLLFKTSSGQESVKILQKAIMDQLVVDPELFQTLAEYQLEKDQIKEAVFTYESGIKKCPDDITLKKNLGVVFASRLKSYREAYLLFKNIVEKTPKDIESLYYLSKISYILKKRKEALEYLDRILQQKVSFSLKNSFEDAKKKIRNYRWRPSFEDVKVNL